MRKLKLQMQISLDGFVTAEYGGTTFNWDEEVKNFSIENLKGVDVILLGRNAAEEIATYWGEVAKDPNNADYKFGKQVTDLPKVVFSSKLKTNTWENATIVSGNIVEEIENLKKKKGEDIMVYGGASFVSSLLENKLIDEFYLLVNPIAFGDGLTIFTSLKHSLPLTLERSKTFSCGTILLFYKAKK